MWGVSVYLIGSATNEECWKSVGLMLSSRVLIYESAYYYISILSDESRNMSVSSPGCYLDDLFLDGARCPLRPIVYLT